MTPQSLLKETQRAAGNENLTTWHEALIRSGQELKDLQTVLLSLAFVTDLILRRGLLVTMKGLPR